MLCQWYTNHTSLLLQTFSDCDLKQPKGQSDGCVLFLDTFHVVKPPLKTQKDSKNWWIRSTFLAGCRFGAHHWVVLNTQHVKSHLYEGPQLVHFNQLSNDLTPMCIKFSDLSYTFPRLESRHQGAPPPPPPLPNVNIWLACCQSDDDPETVFWTLLFAKCLLSSFKTGTTPQT